MPMPTIIRLLLATLLVVTSVSPGSGQTSPPATDLPQWTAAADPANGTSLKDRPARLTVEALPLPTALSLLSSTSGVPVAFSPSMLPRSTVVSCACADATVSQALHTLLGGTGFEYREAAEYIVVLPRPERTAAPQGLLASLSASDALLPGLVGRLTRLASARQDVVAGVVVSEETGAPLQGAQVAVNVARRGAVTDAEGRFRIEGLEEGSEVTLRVVLLGYRQETTMVRVGSTDLRIALEQTAIELEEVIATGTLSPTRRREIATPVTVITAEEIEAKGVQRIDQLFRGTVPGMIAWDQGSVDVGTDIRIRGNTQLFPQPGGVGSSGVKIYIDGVEIADRGVTISSLDPANVERIEVLRGPQAATLYGPEALGGVIQIFMKKGDGSLDRPRIDAKVSAGFIESDFAVDDPPLVQDHGLAVSGGGDAFSYRLAGGFQETGEWTPRYLARTGNLNGSFRFTDGRFEASGTLNHIIRRSHLGVSPLLASAIPTFFTNEGPYDVYNYRSSVVGGQLGYAATPYWRHTLAVGLDQSGFDVEESELGEDGVMRIADQNLTKSTIRYHTAYELHLGDVTSEVLGGFDAVRYRRSYGSTSTARRDRAPLGNEDSFTTRERWGTTGYFAQASLGFDDAVFVTAGVRADDHTDFGDEYGTAWAPRIGAAYNWRLGSTELKLRGEWGKAIRAPDAVAKIGQESQFFIDLPNPDIGPEEQSGWEAGLDVYFRNGLSLTVTRYDQHVEELIANVSIDPAAQPRISQYQNIGAVDNKGWELEGRLDLLPLELLAAVTHMSTTITALSPTYTGPLQVGDRGFGIPEWTLGASASYRLGGGVVTLDVSHLGETVGIDFLAQLTDAFSGVFQDGRTYYVPFDAITKFDLRAELPLAGGVRAFGWVDNLTNNQQTESANRRVHRGRTIGIGLRASY